MRKAFVRRPAIARFGSGFETLSDRVVPSGTQVFSGSSDLFSNLYTQGTVLQTVTLSEDGERYLWEYVVSNTSDPDEGEAFHLFASEGPAISNLIDDFQAGRGWTGGWGSDGVGFTFHSPDPHGIAPGESNTFSFTSDADLTGLDTFAVIVDNGIGGEVKAPQQIAQKTATVNFSTVPQYADFTMEVSVVAQGANGPVTTSLGFATFDSNKGSSPITPQQVRDKVAQLLASNNAPGVTTNALGNDRLKVSSLGNPPQVTGVVLSFTNGVRWDPGAQTSSPLTWSTNPGSRNIPTSQGDFSVTFTTP